MTLVQDVPRPALTGIAHRLASLSGWRRCTAAAAFGAAAAFALPPGYLAPLFWVAFPALLWLLDGARTRAQAFGIGWWFAFGHFLFGLYWVAAALFVDIASFWWVLPLAVGGLPMGLALFVGAATLAVHASGLRGAARVIVFAMAWSAAEWLRGHVFTGFPWNLAGYAWVEWTPVLQAVSWIGIYGLSLLTVLAAATPYLLGRPDVPRRRAAAAAGIGLLLFAGIGAAGAARLAAADGSVVPDLNIRIIQPNINNSLARGPDAAATAFRQVARLHTEPPPPARTIVVWPETAVPFSINRDPSILRAIGELTPPDGYTFAASVRVLEGPQPAGEGGNAERVFRNSLFVVTPDGDAADVFDKFHLVPFGEYIPLRWLFPGVAAVAAGTSEFTPGPGPRAWHLPGVPPVSPLVCYEVVFPAAVVDRADRPAWLVNVTNDAWFGRTAGPYQHFAIARTRAVEEGVPLVRAALTGISGMVDPYGRVPVRLGLGETGVLDTPLPAALPSLTPYARYGDWSLVVLLMILASCVPFARLHC
ncbi:MAG TPA: apolipoprotein N-acyltransferase [Azospirillaceae bacterium]|nr:apolipoprotein N-acyltransferase [Azospirillaceae bacterium]